MKTTKKLLVLCLIAVMAMVAVMPSTFSWYAHNGQVDYQGNEMVYQPSGNYMFFGDGETTEFTLNSKVTAVKSVTVNDTLKTVNTDYTFNSSTHAITFTTIPALNARIVVRSTKSVPLSLQQTATPGDTVSMTTMAANEYGQENGNASFSIARNSTQRYITTLTNNGSKPISVDLDMTGITNNSKVYVGTCDPVVNEKSFASRASLEKVDWDYEVIYFEPRNHYSWWNGTGTGYVAPTNAYGGGITFNSSMTNDMNLEYQIGNTGGTETSLGMQKCPNKDVVTAGSEEYDVYRAFVTTEADSLFFFNHFYITEDSNKEWNRTPTVNDFYEGRVYYLNGNSNSYNNKDLSYHDAYTATNICVYNYYKTATMAIGKTADIGLNQGTAEDVTNGNEFDYTGASISYAVTSNPSVCSVSRDGLITAKAAGTATVTTTITGEFGDTLDLETTVNVPSSIDQVPIMHNIEIPAGENNSVDVIWYVKNDTDSTASFSNVFCNV